MAKELFKWIRLHVSERYKLLILYGDTILCVSLEKWLLKSAFVLGVKCSSNNLWTPHVGDHKSRVGQDVDDLWTYDTELNSNLKLLRWTLSNKGTNEVLILSHFI